PAIAFVGFGTGGVAAVPRGAGSGVGGDLRLPAAGSDASSYCRSGPDGRRPSRLMLRFNPGGRRRCVAEFGQDKLVESTRVVHIGVPIAERWDCNGQVLYLLTICILELGQDERIPVHAAEDLSDANHLKLAAAVDIGDLDRGRRGAFGHSVPVPRVGLGG